MKITDNRFLAMFSLLIFAWALVYQDALVAMEAIWSRSDTFAHGYFILPISLWLLWRDKANLIASTVQPSWLALPLLAGSLFVGLFAYAADINVLGQLSAVTSLIFLLWLLIGNKLAWRYKFPLAYLLFAVPMGENLIPWLQDVTAWFTVFFLKINGIPVYVDGLYIQIPTGMFEVAVACSGIRYLIASAAVGALYGHLTYQKIHKQIIFFVFALTLPILANGIRAYGIVAIAYYSDMEYATGADHLIYGWLFFGLIIMLMFWIGGFFADQEPVADNEKLNASSPKSQFNYLVPSISLPLLFISFYLAHLIPSVDVSKKQLNNTEVSDSSWGINFANALDKTQSINESGVERFRAVYANKQTQGEMISWENVTHDHDKWTVVSTKTLSIDGQSAMLVHLRSINGQPRSYLYQYKVGDFYAVNENKTKLMQAWNSLTRQSDFSEIRAVSIVELIDFDLAEQRLLDSFKSIDFPAVSFQPVLKGNSTVE
ncbi:exosortase A [Colwellia sp. 12G3]|uniref:exosortase A n=1 Tax=Colwellia sp. 12G3 TaxID=2058299 RepID=UPI0018E2C5C0|nr:exosortase A [Colwellia sp. 12G3]